MLQRGLSILCVIFLLCSERQGFGQGETIYDFAITHPANGDTLISLGEELLTNELNAQKNYARLILAIAYKRSKDLDQAEATLKKFDRKLSAGDIKLVARYHYVKAYICKSTGSPELCLLHLDTAIQYSTATRDTLNLNRS